jgi:uncharacterized protein
MKYLIIIVAVFIGLWLWRNGRRIDGNEEKVQRPKAQPATPLAPTEIIACDVCSVHLPRSEALPGGRGIYCSDAHRKQAEG